MAAGILVILLLCFLCFAGGIFGGVPGARTRKDNLGAGAEEAAAGITLNGMFGAVNGAAPRMSAAEKLLAQMVSEMTLEEKVGQMFLVRCPEADAEAAVETWQPGGYLFFARDFRDRTPEQVQAAIGSYQAASKVPMLMGADEEGGIVNRISLYAQFRKTPFLSPQELYQEGGFPLIEQDTEEKCRLLASLGLNLNMAPVCDISASPEDYIYPRTFGGDGKAAAEYVERVVTVMNTRKIGCVLKHFPGYGGNGDTHKGFSYDDRPWEEYINEDFLPFQAGIDAGAGAVLVSHNMVSAMDSQNPASLSSAVHQVLRGELGFAGVIMTDDLDMDAIKEFAGAREAAVLAVQAGNDMLCCTDYEDQIPAVIAGVRDGEIKESRIDESVLRILKWKYALGLIELPLD